jgi:antitoxin ParD1/3/4
MPTIEKLSIALPTEMATLVRRAVDAGEYSSNSEVIRDALRDWTHKRNLREQSLKNLRKLWQEAVADDSEGLDPDAVFDRLRGKYGGLAKAAERLCDCGYRLACRATSKRSRNTSHRTVRATQRECLVCFTHG